MAKRKKQAIVPIEKRTKKEQEAYNKSFRVTNGMNTGTRSHETDKRPSRAREKVLLRKEIY